MNHHDGSATGPTDGTHVGCRSASGRIVATLFLSVILLMGLLFVVLLVGDAVQQAAVWLWPEHPCTILASGVETTDNDQEPYRASVLFEYRVDGRTMSSRRPTRSPSDSASYDRVRRWADRYPAGSRATCRVHPDTSELAVLEPRLPWTVLFVFVPLVFVAIGVGGIFATWRAHALAPSGAQGESISERVRTGRNLGAKIELIIGVVFTAVGGGLTIFLLVLPVTRLAIAQGWLEVPATVVASTVRSWRTDDGTSYRADVLYEYSAAGRFWRSNRRGFSPMHSADAEAARATVERYPAGAEIPCFVDPGDPGRSVLDRRLRPVYLIGLFPLVFLLVGLALVAHVVQRRRRRGSARGFPSAPASGVATEPSAVFRELEPATGPVARVVGMLLIAAFWNGIVAIFVWQAVKAFRSGHPDWFLTIFLTPFVVVGLALIVGVFYTALAAFNPRPRLTITPAAPRLGERLRVEWRFAGRAARMTHLAIILEGYESATYRRGTDTVTDREAFASFELADTPTGTIPPRGAAEIAIPGDTMHSFASANNAVIWSLSVHGDIPRWPDVDESFQIEVRPMTRDRLLP